MKIDKLEKTDDPLGEYPRWSAKLSGHLGGVYPFYDILGDGVLSLDIKNIFDARQAHGESIKLDPVGLSVKAISAYLLGNRTLIEGVSRAPWVSLHTSDSEWLPESLPLHGSHKPADPALFIQHLKQSLISEIQGYIGGAGTVGILLSGGMDSRVVAGVVREVQQLEGNRFQVVGLTWGKETSRDVVYAKRVTDQFGWSWQHYPLNSDILARNIRHMGKMGAEVSPLHLHAMPDIAATPGIDVILAGSYGDSVGRAEFSGKHLTQLRPLLDKQKDKFGILRRGLMREVQAGLTMDLLDTPHLSGNISQIRRHEIEQECHYMRRMLQCCMNTISEHKPFYQAFTSPDVFGLMWGLDPSVRDNRWYTDLLRELPGNLLEIPWARTGRRYDQDEGAADTLSKSYHEYGPWLRSDLKDQIVDRINSDKIRSLGLFNDRGLDYALHAWSRSKTNSINSLDELFSWIASLHDFIDIYQIETQEPFAHSDWLDGLNALRGGAYARVFVEVRNRMRR